jgi:hypothetical protein
MTNNHLPPMLAVRQKFPPSRPLDIRATVQQEFDRARLPIKPGAQIAVALGSRGITNLQVIAASVIAALESAGAKPFIVPAMGSHGGATPEGQVELLAEYGITESHLKVPIRSAMEVERLAVTEEGHDVFFSAEALRADGILVVNRVKPHTDFASTSLGSGLLKMMVVGLGKRIGAANYHRTSVHLGFEAVIRKFARVILRDAPILGGLAIVEDQFHQPARLTLLARDEMEQREGELFAEAKGLMPKLPFDEIDLLIVDRIGKNISGSGMDPNIIGRGIHGYLTSLQTQRQMQPVIRRLFVRDLTPETHGNAIGIGLADFTTTRLVRAMDAQKTYINSLTSLSLASAKIPIHFETDREAITQALASLAVPDISQTRIVRIADTLSLEKVAVSQAYEKEFQNRTDLEVISPFEEMKFDSKANLPPLA